MQQVLFVGGEEKTLSLLKDYLKDRSPVIDTDNNILYIVLIHLITFSYSLLIEDNFCSLILFLIPVSME